MNCRRVHWLSSPPRCVSGALLCLLLSACGPQPDALAPIPIAPGTLRGRDVVLITLDTTRRDHIGCYGAAPSVTPNIDRLCARGVRLDQATAVAPVTLPAHASMLTGLYPPRHGARYNGERQLVEAQHTLAELLQAQGYRSAAFVSAFVLDRRFGLAQGFDHYDDRTEPLPGQPFGGLGERSATAVTDAALGWIGAREAARPLFLWVHYYDPHAEYKPPPAYSSSSPYDGEIAYMDAEIGRLMATLEESSDRLLLVVAGDHGESFGEHSEYSHSRLLYETTQRVPLLLWSPALLSKPRVVDGVVGLVDIFPTVLDLLGIENRTSGDGVSFRLAGSDPERSIYMETLAPYLDNGWAPLHALRRRRDKYIFAPRPEYYDLSADPGERDNLHEERGEAAAKLAEELARRLEGTPSAEAIAAAAMKPDPESLRRLQALGYLSGDAPMPSEDASLPDPKDMMPIQGLLMESRGLRRAGRLEEALAKARGALEQAPRDLEALEETALVYIEMNQLSEAEAALRAYAASKPNPNIYILLAEILAETGRLAEGEALLSEAMELEPDHGGVMITTGDLLAKRGSYEEALAWYLKAKAVDPYRSTAVADRRIVELRRRASGS